MQLYQLLLVVSAVLIQTAVSAQHTNGIELMDARFMTGDHISWSSPVFNDEASATIKTARYGDLPDYVIFTILIFYLLIIVDIFIRSRTPGIAASLPRIRLSRIALCIMSQAQVSFVYRCRCINRHSLPVWIG